MVGAFSGMYLDFSRVAESVRFMMNSMHECITIGCFTRRVERSVVSSLERL
jgi:hypothetical protein